MAEETKRNEVPVTIRTPFIKLEQLLKLSGLTGTGGEAKAMIQDGAVQVNGAVCTMRGKKIRGGDTVLFAGSLITVTAPEEPEI